jgi:two-component system sensor histidine kinase/response regulator
MLQLVLRNLVGNAIKFTPFGGKIEISAEMTGIECKVTVKDSGIGIAYAQQPGIFSLKAESTFGTNNEKGVGLGLLLCKEFIERQGGRISFESTPGQGSSFFILLATEPGERSPAQQSAKVSTAGKTYDNKD